MRSTRLLAGLGLVVAASVAVVDPAGAKGAESATLSGPGLEEPIVVSYWGEAARQAEESEFPVYLGYALTDLTQDYLWDTEGAVPLADHVSERLGEKYTLTWVWSHAPDEDPAGVTYVLELYPWAYLGPMVRALPNDYSREVRWFKAPNFLRDILVAYGVPADPDIAPQLVAKQTPVSPPESAKDEPFAIWPPAAAIAAFVTFTAGLVLGRRRGSDRGQPVLDGGGDL